MEEQVEKRLQSLEAGFHIVANQIVSKIEEIHRDVREQGRENREHGRDVRELRRDMSASFQQVAAAQEQLEQRLTARMDTLETHIMAGFQQLVAVLVERLPPKQGE